MTWPYQVGDTIRCVSMGARCKLHVVAAISETGRVSIVGHKGHWPVDFFELVGPSLPPGVAAERHTVRGTSA